MHYVEKAVSAKRDLEDIEAIDETTVWFIILYLYRGQCGQRYDKEILESL